MGRFESRRYRKVEAEEISKIWGFSGDRFNGLWMWTDVSKGCQEEFLRASTAC